MYPNIKWHEQNPCSPPAPPGEIWFSTSLLPVLQRQMVVSWCPLLVLDTRTVQGANLYPRAAGPPTLSPLEDRCPWSWAGSSCSLCPVSRCLASIPASRMMTWLEQSKPTVYFSPSPPAPSWVSAPLSIIKSLGYDDHFRLPQVVLSEKIYILLLGWEHGGYKPF